MTAVLLPPPPAPPTSVSRSSLHLARITLREIRLALDEPRRIASARRALLLELEDEDGAAAWSECVAFPRPTDSPESIDTAWLAIRESLGPRLLGHRLPGPEVVHDLLMRDTRGQQMARAALEMGCWGLAAERDGVALATRLGGTRRRVQACISLDIQPAATLVDRARAAVAAGYRDVELKIRPGQDVEHVRALRETLGPDVRLMVDANAAYTIADAPHLLELDAFGLAMLEQPFGVDALLELADLQRRMRTPLSLDESIVDVSRALEMITLQSGRIINIKPGRVGGLTASKAIHDVCLSAGIPVRCGGIPETGIGRAYNVALASLPNVSLGGDVSPSVRYRECDIASPEWTMDADGMVRVPYDRPGLGVAVDAEMIDALTARMAVVRTDRVAVGS